MALAGRSRLILGLVFLVAVGDAWQHWHYPSYTDSEEVSDMKRSVIQPVVRKSAQLARYEDDAHPRYRREALPINYRSLTTSEQDSLHVAPHCTAWSQSHFKTFDGKTYNFHGACQYTLVLDCAAYTFRISIQNDFECFTPGTGASCNRTVVVHNGDAVSPIYLRPGLVVGHQMTSLDLPTTLDGLVIERVGDSIMVTSGLGYKVLYDGDESVTVYITSDSLRQQTCGLCGVYNDDPSDDFKGPFGTVDSAYDFGLAWKEDSACEDVPPPTVLCTQIFIPPHLVHQYKDFIDLSNFAKATCKELEDDPSFASCHSVIDVNPYIEACQRDVCNCQNGQDQCACNSLAAYAQECARYGVRLDWRTAERCSWTCPVGTVYNSCGTTCTQMCGSAASDCEEDRSIGCIEGCQCTADRYLNSEGQCVKEENCPCVSNGVEYDTGSTISDGCNHCTCNGGKWTCTDKVCETLCWASGDPHYKTFDDTRYNFMGECAYYLVKDCWNDDDKFEIIADNAPCGHQGLTCTQKVIVRNENEYVTLFRNHRVSANGNDVSLFPYVGDGIVVDQPTTMLTMVSLGNGMIVRWDGNNRVEIVAPPSKFNSTCGLCGTFNKNQADDFMKPDGERVASAEAFGNSWKASYAGDTCPDIPPGVGPPDVCELYSQRRSVAFDQCNKLFNEPVFQPCHRVLDPSQYVEDCRYDVCNGNGNDNHCPMFSTYASDCRQKGVTLDDWRKAIPECDVPCNVDGMSYSECAPSCGASCQSIHAISNGADCIDVCVEGCHCDNGKVLGPDGTCIPPNHCPCLDDGNWYNNGHTINKGCGTCTCHAGNWQCTDLTCPIIQCPENQFYSECALPVHCRPTCANFHDPPTCDGDCTRECECDTGYVLHNGVCTAIADCPCSHRGEVYEPNEVVRIGCQICTCENGRMDCQNEYCEGTCIAWGDPHYQTFDGKKYNFQGECDYVLVTNSHFPEAKQFHILVANVPCGSGGVTCTKAITFAIGTGAEQEKVLLVRGKPIEVDTGIGGLSEFTITESGVYIFVHTHIGVTLMWDRATRVEVKVTHRHFNRVGGLCGNYNDMQEDDFLPPGGGIAYVDPNDFGNSWKVHDYCGKPGPITDPCEENPHRKTWAQKQCSVINSDLFQPCHQYVRPAEYFNNCVYDSCGCNTGGDCECMCTAIATYAQKCNEHGVPIKWRSQDLCPIQCEGCLTYDPCIPVCESSCENKPFTLPSGPCLDTCVEGCACPPGTILHEDKCIEECEPVPTTVRPTFEEPPVTTPKRPPTTQPPTTKAPTTVPTTEPEPTTPGEICDCWGYGDPHYFDFNGQEFDDQGLCTYILAKDSQEPPRFVVLIHNIECGMFPGTTCPKEIEVLFDGHKIRMLAKRTDAGEYQVIIDSVTHTLPVETFGSFTITEAGLYMLFDAPSIGLQVRYLPVDLHYFKVEVPQVIFYNSTEGLCGNCGNPQPSCEETQSCCDWLAPPSLPSECGCDVEPTECIPGPDIVHWCDKLYEDIFSECHSVVDPDGYHKNCLYNNCYAKDLTCWDFEAYITECSAAGICIDWREDDFCPYDCKNDQTHYRECACPDDIYLSCYPWDKDPDVCQLEPVSGCFCNEGTMDNGNGTCIPCPTEVASTTRAVVFTTEAVESTTPEVTTRPGPPETTRPESTTVESTPPESTTTEAPPVVTTKPPPPKPTTAESTPPASTTVESTPPESTTTEPPPVVTTKPPPPKPTTAESTPPASTTVESTPPESTTTEPPPVVTTKPPPPKPTTAESTTVESTPPASTTVESTPPESTTTEPPPVVTTKPPPPKPTTAESTTVKSTPPASTTVESTPPQSTTTEAPPIVTTKPPPPKPTTAESTTVESTPPESTTVESTPPESTTVESTPSPTTAVKSTTERVTTKPPPPKPTTPESTTVESTPPESTTVESTPPESTTVESTPPESTTVESTPPASTTTKPTPEATTVETTQPSTTGVTTVERTTAESTPVESTTVESTTAVPPTTPEVVGSTTVEQPTTTECVPGVHRICKWSQYLDDEQGEPIGLSYEFELIQDFVNDERYTDVCAEPEAIECVLARDHSVPYSMTTQDVQCTPDLGLACYNGEDQTCLDYAIRIHCCEEVHVVCGSTEAPPTTVLPESTTEISTVPQESTTVGETTPEAPSTTAAEPTTEPQTTVCVPHHEYFNCEWTRYYDESDSPHGDFEVLGDLSDAHPGEICESPTDIECVLSSDHGISAHQTGQNFTCLPQVGFLCLDFANNRRQPYKCYDYSVRFQCCDSVYIPCGSTEEPPTTVVVDTTPEPTTELVVTTEESTTECVDVVEEACKWTPWLDDEEGKVGPMGEFELISTYREEYEICDTPSKVECVLKTNRNVHSNQTNQVLTCDVDEGLVCLHSEQTNFPPFCFDYMIRVECCQEIVVPCIPHTTEPEVTTKPAPTTHKPQPTTEAKPTTEEQPTTKPASTTTKEVPTEPPKESTTVPISTLPPESTTELPTTIIESTTAESTTLPEEPTTRAVTTEADFTTPCKPVFEEVCEWTPWLDDEGDGKVGPIGEFEIISFFRDQYDICEEPRNIQCVLKSDHSVFSNMTLQNLLCSRNEGLLCLHNDQPDIVGCFDYIIRLQCCSYKNIGCATTPEPLVTTVTPTLPNVPSTTAPSHINDDCRPVMSDESVTITKNGCSSPTPVFLPECQGRCESHTYFNGFEGNGNEYWKSACRCCRPSAFETDHYELMCPDGEAMTLPVDIVTECTCTEFECP